MPHASGISPRRHNVPGRKLMKTLTVAAIAIIRAIATPLARRLEQLLEQPLTSARQRTLLTRANRHLQARRPDLDRAGVLVNQAERLDATPNPDIRRLRRALDGARLFVSAAALLPVGMVAQFTHPGSIARQSAPTRKALTKKSAKKSAKKGARKKPAAKKSAPKKPTPRKP